MAKKNFPQILHVTSASDGDEKYLLAHLGGIYDVAKPGELVECAIYKLVTVGKVIAKPEFQPG